LVPLPVKDDRLTRGGPLSERPADYGVGLWVFSDNRKPVHGNVNFSTRRDVEQGGSANEEVSVGVTARPTPAIQLAVVPTYYRGVNARQYVARVDDEVAPYGRRDVFARLQQQTLSLGLRANWTFRENVSLQLYAQPFVSAGRYSEFKEYAEPGTAQFTVYGEDRGAIAQSGGGYVVTPGDGGAAFTISDPDFSVRSLRANAVFRWEYLPGSTLFVVWQQQRSGFDREGRFAPWNDAGSLLHEPAHNVFMVKLAYRLST
jgi:hypothetical protein